MKIGDRVKLIGFGEHGGESCDVDGKFATVVQVSHQKGVYGVQVDGQGWYTRVYESQCEVIVMPREFWIQISSMRTEVTESKPEDPTGWFHVMEVR